jgi:hypothetical protein
MKHRQDYSKNKKCKNCGISICNNSNKYCLVCSNKLLPHCYIDGRSLKANYCIDCLKLGIKTEISWRAKRCKSCANIKKVLDGKIGYHGKHFRYKDINFKSSWEYKYAKYLTKNNIKWLYEPKTFDLGDTTYTPDFYLPKTKEHIEIKGYWRNDAKKKFKLFKKLYPKIKIILLTAKELKTRRIL